MTQIQIFVATQPVPASDQAALEWVQAQGADLKVFDLDTQAAAFHANAGVSAILTTSGRDALPVVLIDGEVTLAGRYPSREELARWSGTAATLQPKKQSDCCGGCC